MTTLASLPEEGKVRKSRWGRKTWFILGCISAGAGIASLNSSTEQNPEREKRRPFLIFRYSPKPDGRSLPLGAFQLPKAKREPVLIAPLEF